MTASSRDRGQPGLRAPAPGRSTSATLPAKPDRDQPDPGEDDVRAAFAAVARERAALAGLLRERGQDLQAGIVDIGALIAADSALVGPAVDAVRAGADGITAVRAAAETQAAVLAALPDPDLAQRAGDVRQVAAAVVDHLRGNTAPPPPEGTFILVRREVDPADLIQLADGGLAGRRVSRRRGQLPRGDHRARPRAAHAGGRRPAGAGRGGRDPATGTPALGSPSSTRTRRPSRPRRGDPRNAGLSACAPAGKSPRPTASRSRCSATSPRPQKPGLACPAARPAWACCAPRSPSPAPRAGRRRPITWPA